MKASPLLTLLVCAALSGCSESGGPQTDVYPVTGKITMHGSPLTDATVSFAPKSDQPTAVGRTNELGEFTLTTYEPGDGAAAGEYAVVVTKIIAPAGGGSDEEADHAAFNAGDVGDGHGAAEQGAGAVMMVPPKYANANDTPLSATVKAGSNDPFEFKIE